MKIAVFIYPFEKVEKIIDFAFRFARDLNAEVEFVHAVETDIIIPDPPMDIQDPDALNMTAANVAMDEELARERKQILKKAIAIKKTSVNLPVAYSFAVSQGSYMSLIDELSKRDDIDLILVPIGPDGAYQIISPDLIDRSSHPVLAFPVNLDYQLFRNIIYASDFHDEDIAVIKDLSRIAERLMASITVYHATRNKADFEEELRKAGFEEMINRQINIRDIPVKQEHSKKAAAGIKEFSRRNYADLIVLMREDKNFFQEFFGHSTTRDLLKDTEIPVLVYHQ